MFLLEWFLGFLNEHWFSNWSSSAQDVGYIPLLFFRNEKFKLFFRNTNFKLALMSSPRFSEAIWVLNSDWVSDYILNVDWLYFHMRRMLYTKLIGRIAPFTCENIAHIEFYLQGLLPRILAIYTINNYTAIQHMKQILDHFAVSAVSSHYRTQICN